MIDKKRSQRLLIDLIWSLFIGWTLRNDNKIINRFSDHNTYIKSAVKVRKIFSIVLSLFEFKRHRIQNAIFFVIRFGSFVLCSGKHDDIFLIKLRDFINSNAFIIRWYQLLFHIHHHHLQSSQTKMVWKTKNSFDQHHPSVKAMNANLRPSKKRLYRMAWPMNGKNTNQNSSNTWMPGKNATVSLAYWISFGTYRYTNWTLVKAKIPHFGQ